MNVKPRNVTVTAKTECDGRYYFEVSMEYIKDGRICYYATDTTRHLVRSDAFTEAEQMQKIFMSVGIEV